MQKFSKSEVKNQSFYTCCSCSAHLYLQADIQSVADELGGHDLNRDDLRNTKRISLNRYTVECCCGAYLGFLRPDHQTVCIIFSTENPIQLNHITSMS